MRGLTITGSSTDPASNPASTTLVAGTRTEPSQRSWSFHLSRQTSSVSRDAITVSVPMLFSSFQPPGQRQEFRVDGRDQHIDLQPATDLDDLVHEVGCFARGRIIRCDSGTQIEAGGAGNRCP